jgi:hypothetical protein
MLPLMLISYRGGSYASQARQAEMPHTKAAAEPTSHPDLTREHDEFDAILKYTFMCK